MYQRLQLPVVSVSIDKDNSERHVQKINSFNKIHVKHQNTEMAKKERHIFFYIFLVLYKSQWFKNITNFSLKTFFFATAAKHSDCCIFVLKALNSL